MTDEEKRQLMNELYNAAIMLRKDQLRFFDGVSVHTLKCLQESGQKLHSVLTRINGGKDPVNFLDKVGNICATAELLSGTT